MNYAKIITYIVSIPLLLAVIVPAIIGSLWFTLIGIVMMPLGFTIGDFKTFSDWYNTLIEINKAIWTYLFRIIEDI